MGLIGEQTDSWAYDLPDGTNTPRQLVDASAAITFSASYTAWGDTVESHGTRNFRFDTSCYSPAAEPDALAGEDS